MANSALGAAATILEAADGQNSILGLGMAFITAAVYRKRARRLGVDQKTAQNSTDRGRSEETNPNPASADLNDRNNAIESISKPTAYFKINRS